MKPNPKFIPSNCTAKIRFSKLILNKTESITFDDFNKVKSILEHHYYEEMMSPEEIKELYIICGIEYIQLKVPSSSYILCIVLSLKNKALTT